MTEYTEELYTWRQYGDYILSIRCRTYTTGRKFNYVRISDQFERYLDVDIEVEKLGDYGIVPADMTAQGIFDAVYAHLDTYCKKGGLK